MGPSGGIAVDSRMRTHAAVVGPPATAPSRCHRLSGQRVVVALGTHANKQGRVAGINLGGGYATFPGVIGTAVTKVSDVEVARTGLTKEAEAAGFGFVTRRSTDDPRRLLPRRETDQGQAPGRERTGRLLGAQIVGREGAAKRIDVLATAMWNEMTVDEVLPRTCLRAAVLAGVGPGVVAARKAFEAVEADLK